MKKISNPQPASYNPASKTLLEFSHVSFGYDEKKVLSDISFSLTVGKTYALVGPTGGGKSTTAGLMARLFDPTEGTIYFKGKDIRSYLPSELAKNIGFILQEPFLFSGTVFDNIVYGNTELDNISIADLTKELKILNLEKLVSIFEDGLDTVVSDNTDNISLGQKQIIHFIRVLLRQPELLIMDEATANIDTVTEKYLTEIIAKLPKSTTKVVIAHRLNTIKEADQIFFITGGEVREAVDFADAISLIDKTKKIS